MPRISIIIAHQHDQRLEDTLLSVLECRPRDCEVIVAHDGSYADPYQLADEVLFIETNASCSQTTKVNEALYAACSPVVHLLSEGVKVTEGWCEAPALRIARQESVAIAPLIETTDGKMTTYAGLDEQRLNTRGLQTIRRNQAPTSCAGPMLAAGFYSRKLLLGLGGLMEGVDSGVVDVDLALTLHDLGLSCEVESRSVVHATTQEIQTPRNAGAFGDLASILTAHHRLSSGTMAGITAMTGKLMSSLVNPSQWAPAVAWGMAIASNRLEAEVEERLMNWQRSQEQQRTATTPQAVRRAA